MKRTRSSFIANIDIGEVYVGGVDVEINASDLFPDVVRYWVENYASSEEIDEVFGYRPRIHDGALEKAYNKGSLSMFEVVDFLRNHGSEIDLHSLLFPA